MKFIIFILLTLVLAGCARRSHTNTESAQSAATAQNAATENQSAATQISSQRAREIAVEFVGYGVANDVIAFTDAGALTFEVDVRHEDIRYVIQINAESGNVTRLDRHVEPEVIIANLPVEAEQIPEEVQEQAAESPTEQPQAANNTTFSNVTPRAPARAGGPLNPSISAQRAVELAHEHLVAIGAANARFDYVYMDMERSTWVWSVEFDSQGRSYEFYVDVSTGAFLKYPQGSSASATSPSAAAQTSSSQQISSQSGDRQSSNRHNPAISLERAIEIAYADLAGRGINATFRSDSGLDWERGQLVWELLFRTQGERMPLIEYYINAENGSIVKFEWDD